MLWLVGTQKKCLDGPTLFVKVKRSSDKRIQLIFENYNLTTLDMYNGLSKVYLSNQKEFD